MKRNILLLALMIGATNMWAIRTEIDTTHVSVSVCESELPYTYEPTGTIFPKGISGVIDSVVVQQGSATHIHLTVIPNPVLNIRPDTAINQGDSALLWVSGASNIKWSSNSPIVQNATLDYYAKPVHSDMYYATGYQKTDSTGNLVINGDFEQGNTGFTTQLIYLEPYTRYGMSGEYTIADDLKGYWLDAISSYKAYGGVGNMFIVDGATTPNTIVWEQTVSVKPNTYYVFSAQEMSCWESYKEGQYALLQFSVNGVPIGNVFHSPTTQYKWEQFYDVWYSGTNTTATLRILNQNNSDLGNDYALDEIRFEPVSALCASEDSVLILVYQNTTEQHQKCASELPYAWNTLTVDTFGMYVDTIISSSSYRDSIITLTVTELLSTDSIEYATICSGDTYTWHGKNFTAATVETETLTNSVGCDSICTLYLTVNPTYHKEVNITVCDKQMPYTWNGIECDKAGDYQLDSVSILGCDSLVTLHLKVDTYAAEDTFAYVCAGTDFYWKGKIAHDGDTWTTTNKAGCDSIVTLRLTTSVAPITIKADTTVCDTLLPMLWRGILFTEKGTYRDTIPNLHYCDSIYRELTLNTVAPLVDTCIDDLVYKKWNDVIFCNNGDKEIVAFQWYRDNLSMSGETKQYYFQNGGIDGAEYFVEITYANGIKRRSCPKVFDITPRSAETYTKVQTVIQRGGTIRIEMSDTEADVSIYSLVGMRVIQTRIYGCSTELPINMPVGVYVLRLVGDNVKHTTKIKVE